METGEILSISQLNETARQLLENNLGLVWVEGEISNFSAPSSGHWYFSLKDSGAQVRCALFYNRRRQVNFVPQNGMQVMAYALVSLYENRGDYQLIVEKLEALGDGALRFEFERLTQKLSLEGLFEAQHKKPLPDLPRCIGVITSSTGAALHDILHVLKRRAPSISIIIYPTAVQGAQAAAQIVTALAQANLRQECDVLILARGGGSLEDLWPFNEEIVARAIFTSQIPIVSGVGHEIDFTISDWVADVRAPTPSAAAELVSPDQSVLVEELERYKNALIYHIKRCLNNYQQQLQFLSQQLKHPKVYWQQLSQSLDYLELRLKALMTQKLEKTHIEFNLQAQLLNNLNPLMVLQRGFAVVMDEEKHVVTSVKQVTPKQKLHVQLQDGNMHVMVI